MTPEELAAKLNGRQYREELTSDEARLAKAHGLVVAYGQSDDLLELRGAIEEEFGAYDRCTVKFGPHGLLENRCSNDECPYHKDEVRSQPHRLTATWNESGDPYAWTIEVDVPSVSFEIFDGEEKYCLGVVFRLPDPAP